MSLHTVGQDSSMVRFLRIDPMVSVSSPTLTKLSLRARRVASSVIPGMGITRCCVVERKEVEAAR